MAMMQNQPMQDAGAMPTPEEGAKPAPKKPQGDPLVEIALCVYPGGKLALKLDQGEKVPVKDIDTAVMAIRKVAEQEAGEGVQKESTEMPQEEEGGEEEAFKQGFRGSSGY